MKEVEEFVEQLSRQVEIRLKEIGKKGKLITFKVFIDFFIILLLNYHLRFCKESLDLLRTSF